MQATAAGDVLATAAGKVLATAGGDVLATAAGDVLATSRVLAPFARGMNGLCLLAISEGVFLNLIGTKLWSLYSLPNANLYSQYYSIYRRTSRSPMDLLDSMFLLEQGWKGGGGVH